MRRFRSPAFAACLVALALCGPAAAQEGAVVPDRRLVLREGSDLVGKDLDQIFDTTLESCETACLADSRCTAFTFNTRNNSCFPKSAVTGAAPYPAAVSGEVIVTAAAVRQRAAAQARDLGFLRPEDFAAALTQAGSLADGHVAGDWTADQLLQSANEARARGDWDSAAWFVGTALTLTDAADLWTDYATLLRSAASVTGAPKDELAQAALSASVNGYLRADGPGQRASALEQMALGLRDTDRGRAMIPALRLAQSLQPRDDISALLDDAIGKFGFRIDEHRVEADSARPRICADFNEPLVAAGVDYATFVRTDRSGLNVEAGGRQICVSGVEHGQRYAVTFREGLPAASGETLARDVTLTLYVRDRSPSVSFPGRAYVLPRAPQVGVPVQTVNVLSLNLRLSKVSDRNLIAAMRSDFFARPLDAWAAETLNDQMAEEVWSGTAEVASQVNQDMTTRLPMDEALRGLAPGVYVLQATIPGADPYETPAAGQWFVVSDLGLATLSGADGLHVIVRGLSDAGPRAGLPVTLVSRANEVIGTATTDAEGYALFPAAMTRGRGNAAPGLVSVTRDEDMSFLSLSEPEFDLSDRGVAGRDPSPPVDVFLTTDRGAYRAGETVNATLLARGPDLGAIEGLPLTLRMLRPDGVEYARALAEDLGAGGHVVSMPIGPAAPRGTWRIEAFAEKDIVLASRSLLVEDFLPERIDFSLSLPGGVLSLGDAPVLDVEARYLFGAPGAGLASEGEVRLAAAPGLPDWPGYVFGRGDAPFATQYETLAEAGETNAEGRLQVPVIFPEPGGPVSQPLEARVTLRLKEGSGRPVEREATALVLPDNPVIGIRPAFSGGELPEGAEARFDLIAVGPDGKRSALPVRWTLNRLETDYQWYSLYGQWNWEATTIRTRIAGGDAAIPADAPLSVGASLDWGRYELVVEAGDGSASSYEFTAGWYVPADAAQTPDMLEAALDRPDYRPGDTATLRIVPRSAGVALVTVMSNRLIDMKVVPVAEGANTIPLPVTADWGAGAYVAATVIRPLAVDAGRAPVRALGLAYAKVDPGAHRLAARFDVAAESAPRAEMPVALKVEGIAPGETAWATIAAVDVGILNLTGFAAPDPEGHYFGQRRLGMGLRDIYGRLISGDGAPGIVRSGGDAGGGLKMQAPPPTEELVAYFSGPIAVGSDGVARTSFEMPSFNGTVRLMAVVWSGTGIGQAQADVLVRDPVVVTASVPRFLAPGDASRVLLEIVHATGPAGRMGLDVSAEGMTLGQGPSGVDLAEKGKAEVAIPFTAPDTEGTATIRVALTTPDGRQLLKTLTVPVQVNDPEILRQTRFTLAPGKTFTLDADAFSGFVPGTGHATIAAGPIARFDAPGLLAALDRYPYGCTEQITSKALPLLYFDQVAVAAGVAGDGQIPDRIRQAITEILLNQSSGGGFGLWYPDSGDLWLDAYVTDFLSRARARGHAVPDTAFRNALDNLRNQINYAPDFDTGGAPYAYALMVLAREGAAKVGDLRYFADVKAEAFDTPMAAAQLGAALASYGDQTRADAMFARAVRLAGTAAGGGEGQVWRGDFGTRLRDQAAVLALAAEAGSAQAGNAGLTDAVARGVAQGRLSTQEQVWALMATQALIDRPGADTLSVDGQPVRGSLVRAVDAQTAAGTALAIRNDGTADTQVTVATFGLAAEPEPAGGNGYTITRRWYSLEGEPVDPASVRQGTRLVAVIEVTPHGSGEARLIVDDPLPAGFEIDNPNLVRGGDIAALDWLETTEETRMTEFRQDRFLAALDWTSTGPFRLAYVVRAVSPGSFHLPAATVEDMYRPTWRAWTDAGRVTVAE